MNSQLAAFLGMIATSEIGSELLGLSDNGYNVLVGSTPAHPNLFSSYADHPREKIWIEKVHEYSTAAGRYQILARYFDAYKGPLGLQDFGPLAQDTITAQMIREVHALDDIAAGRIEDAITKCAGHWASFPASGYGQHENKIEELRNSFVAAGGQLA